MNLYKGSSSDEDDIPQSKISGKSFVHTLFIFIFKSHNNLLFFKHKEALDHVFGKGALDDNVISVNDKTCNDDTGK